jgi:large subunit ribosomal protein L25
VAFEIAAEPRAGSGRAETRRLRRAGRVPAIVYGGGETPSAITLEHEKIAHQMENESFYTSILTIKVDGKQQPVVVKEVQRHPARHQIMHVDFQRIVADEEITLDVPIHFMNENIAVGVKEQGGVVEHLMSDAEVVCLPRDLPEYLEVDVAGVGLNDILHLSDIKLPNGVALVVLEHGSDQPIFTISPPRREEEIPTEAPAAPEAPAPEAEATEATAAEK